MIKIDNVSSTIRPIEVDIDSSKDTKYIRYNILEEKDEFDNVIFTYTEEQYTPDEFIQYQIIQLEKQNKSSQDNIGLLKEQNNIQEENIALLTYEVMILQPEQPVSISEGEKSKKYDMIKSWFIKGYWTESMVLDAVEKGQLTLDEATEIVQSDNNL